MRGMRTSSSTRSGGSASIISSAVTPSAATRTSQVMPPRYILISSRLAAPSSTTMTTGMPKTRDLHPILNPGSRRLASAASRESPASRSAATASGGCGPGYSDGHAAVAHRGEGKLELPVGAGDVAPALEDLGVDRAVAGLPLRHVDLVEDLECGGELRVGCARIALGLEDAAEPHVRLGDVGGLAEPSRQVKGCSRVARGCIVVRSSELELRQRHEELLPPDFDAQLFTQAQRGLGMAKRVGEVALHVQQEGEVVLGAGEHALLTERLVDGDRSVRVTRGLGEPADLLVAEAQVHVDHREAAKVLDRD